MLQFLPGRPTLPAPNFPEFHYATAHQLELLTRRVRLTYALRELEREAGETLPSSNLKNYLTKKLDPISGPAACQAVNSLRDGQTLSGENSASLRPLYASIGIYLSDGRFSWVYEKAIKPRDQVASVFATLAKYGNLDISEVLDWLQCEDYLRAKTRISLLT